MTCRLCPRSPSQKHGHAAGLIMPASRAQGAVRHLHPHCCTAWPVALQRRGPVHLVALLRMQAQDCWTDSWGHVRRAVLVQFGFFGHMKRVMGFQSFTVTRPLIFAASFMLLFSIVIALFKDIPDVKGDGQVRPLS